MDDQDREGMENGFSMLGRRVEELEMEVSPKKLVIQNMLKNSVSNAKILSSLARDVVNNKNEIDTTQRWVKTETHLRKLSTEVSRLRFDRAQLRAGLEAALKNYLSPELLSPKFLLKV